MCYNGHERPGTNVIVVCCLLLLLLLLLLLYTSGTHQNDGRDSINPICVAVFLQNEWTDCMQSARWLTGWQAATMAGGGSQQRLT